MSNKQKQPFKLCGNLLLGLALLLLTAGARAEIPTVLTDTIKSGSGDIDLLKDVTTTELDDALSGGTLYLGVDLNEEASPPEGSTAQGVAIKELELVITTTEGTFTYSSFYTNTTATILEQGATEAEEYYTLFGQTGSSNITSSTQGFDLATFDDVLVIEDISYTGEILDAQLNVTFLNTAKTGSFNEEFFDYSAGLEDVAILSLADAQTLESADVGLDSVPETVTFTKTEPSASDIAAPSGAPEPHWLLLAALPALLLARAKRT